MDAGNQKRRYFNLTWEPAPNIRNVWKYQTENLGWSWGRIRSLIAWSCPSMLVRWSSGGFQFSVWVEKAFLTPPAHAHRLVPTYLWQYIDLFFPSAFSWKEYDFQVLQQHISKGSCLVERAHACIPQVTPEEGSQLKWTPSYQSATRNMAIGDGALKEARHKLVP